MGADGIKTGYLAVEKYSLASSLERNGRRLIAVGSGFETKNSRSRESSKLLTYGLTNFDLVEINKFEKPIDKVDVWLGKENQVEVYVNENIYVVDAGNLFFSKELVDKGISKSLEPFIAKEAAFEKDGYHSAMLSLSTFGGEVYGLPFSVSTPVGYYNMDLLAEAGVDSIPTNWDEVIAACNKLEAAGKGTLYFGWNITGNWFHQALMHTQNVPMVKDGAVNMGGDAGLATLEQMKAIMSGCNMPNYSIADGQAAFNAGTIGMMFWSTSSLGSVNAAKADFVLKTAPFPGMAGVNNGTPARLPAGGNAAMLVSTSDDPARVDAAWTFLKFITSGIGAALVAETTGYVPPNKAANDLLGDFYSQNPNKLTAVEQLPLLADWFAYPGENGLAVTQVIYDFTEEIATGDADDMADLQEEMMEEINDLM